jgi:hypothetical protein
MSLELMKCPRYLVVPTLRHILQNHPPHHKHVSFGNFDLKFEEAYWSMLPDAIDFLPLQGRKQEFEKGNCHSL